MLIAFKHQDLLLQTEWFGCLHGLPPALNIHCRDILVKRLAAQGARSGHTIREVCGVHPFHKPRAVWAQRGLFVQLFLVASMMLIRLKHVVATLVASTAAGNSTAVQNFAVQRVRSSPPRDTFLFCQLINECDSSTITPMLELPPRYSQHSPRQRLGKSRVNNTDFIISRHG